jgi:hypothetical protein
MTAPAGYSGTPLPRKLGIRAGSRVLLDSVPPEFALDPLPEGVAVHTRPRGEPYDVIVAFCADRRRATERLSSLAARMTRAGALWLCWPKRTSGVATDLTENVVRDIGLAGGLVDVKVAAVDAVWSGLKFVVRLRDR